jgi:DNA-binding HxlR family transcriptional regulator
MQVKKENTTNQLNNNTILQCPVAYTLEKIGGRWKTLILYKLKAGPLRYGQLKKMIPLITEKMLAQQLRELEADNLVYRDVKPILPPHVEYYLTEQGQGLSPILAAMAEWGRGNNPAYRDCE